MLFKLYLGTTALNLIVAAIYGIAGEKRIQRKGYKRNKVKRTFIESLPSYLSILFYSAIPIYNIITVIYILSKGDELFDNIEAELIQKGKLRKAEPETNESNSFAEMKLNNFNKSYNDMTREEKITFLKQEQEKLLHENDYKEHNIENKKLRRTPEYKNNHK